MLPDTSLPLSQSLQELTDSVVYSVHVNVVRVAGACWVARSVLPQQMGMSVRRLRRNAYVLENSIT